jgi:chromosome segregation ATPase
MKISYSGTIQTREVKDTARDVRNIIRDMKGRIDSENTQEKYASIQFVIPKSNFDDFRDEIESLTHKKLYVENTSSQNLLNQKQNIEQRTETTTQTIDELKLDLEKTTSAYTQKNASLQKQLAAAKSSLATKQSQLASITVTEGTPEYFKSQQTLAETFELRDKINLLNQQISAEKASFTHQKNNLTNQILGSNKDLEVIKKDDVNLNDNLETVNGSIQMNWVSLWELATVFSPIHPIILILLLIPLIWFIFRKIKIIPLVVFHW